jgi:hypothetical protein
VFIKPKDAAIVSSNSFKDAITIEKAVIEYRDPGIFSGVVVTINIDLVFLRHRAHQLN